MKKRLLVVLDFDGFLVNSYAIIRDTMDAFGLDIGDELRFKNRRKFLKYFGGGKELLTNLVGFTLPKTRKLRARLTQAYIESASVHSEYVELLNEMIANPQIHCGVVSRNYALDPGPTIRTVLARSGIDEADLDFVIPLPVGVKKGEVLAGMRSSRYSEMLLAADEIGDYTAGSAAGYDCLIGSYGFDTRERLIVKGEVPEHVIYDNPVSLAAALKARVAPYEVRSSVAPLPVAESGFPSIVRVSPKGARYPAKSAVQLAQE
jgi:phosphoglycolate phosphatase-like HAD superfamily hydrolase